MTTWGVTPLVALAALLMWQSATASEPAPPPARRTVSPGQRGHARTQPTLGHTIRSGDTLWQIARQHGVTVEALVRKNHIVPTQRLRVGERLAIPSGFIEPDRQEPPSLAEIVLGPPPSTPEVRFIWPVPGAMLSAFGPRGRMWHGGVDLRAERGTPIVASAAGMVISSGWERAYGRVIKVWHLADLMTVYAHNHENLVKVGDWVEQGQVLATAGATGRASAPHLHFEIRLDGKKYNPLYWLPEPGSVEIAASDPLHPTVLR